MRTTAAWLGGIVANARFLLVAIEGFDRGVEIEHPLLFEQGSEGAIHLQLDPGGDGVVIGVFKGAAHAVFTAEGVDSEQASHDGVAAEGGDVGVAALAGEDGVDHGGEYLGFERSVGTGVSQGAGVDKLGPGVTGFEKVDEVSEEAVASDGGGGFPMDFDGAAEGVDAVGRREAGGGGRGFTLWVNGQNGVDRAHPF